MIVIFCSLPRAEILGRHVDDPVGVDVEGHLDLGHAARRRRMPVRWNLPRVLLWAGHLPLPLEDVDLDAGLAVGGRGEDLALLRVGMVVLRSISLVNTPPRVSIPRVSGVTSRSRMSLTSPARTPAWIAAPMATTSSGIHALVGLLAEELLHHLLDLRDARRTADQHDLVDVLGREPGVGERLLAGAQRALQQSSIICSNLAREQLSCRCLGRWRRR